MSRIWKRQTGLSWDSLSWIFLNKFFYLAYLHECKQLDEGSDHSPLVNCFLDYIFLGLNALEEAQAPSIAWWRWCPYVWGQATQATWHEAAVPAPLCLGHILANRKENTEVPLASPLSIYYPFDFQLWQWPVKAPQHHGLSWGKAGALGLRLCHDASHLMAFYFSCPFYKGWWWLHLRKLGATS